MDVLSGVAIFLLGASAGSVLRYFQDRKLIQLYRREAQKCIQVLLEVVHASQVIPEKKPVASSRSASAESATPTAGRWRSA